MGRYVLSAEAEEDIRDILRYSGRTYGEAASIAYVGGLTELLFALGAFPGMGTLQLDLPDGTRRHVHRAHAIYYEEIDDGIRVRRVLHTQQDVKRRVK